MNQQIRVLAKREEALFDDMTLPIEDDSETATEGWKSVPPSGSDDHVRGDRLTPSSSPPPMKEGVSFKPFTMSRAQKRAIAEKASRERSAAKARTMSETDNRQTTRVGQVEKRVAEKLGSDKTPDSTDLKSLIDAAKQKALANNKPKKADRVAELYQRSLNDKRLTVLLGAALRSNATPEQQHELQKYVDGTKTTTNMSQNTAPKDSTITPLSTTTSETKAQTSIAPTQATTTTTTSPKESSTPALVATFCATQLWPRYCRLPPAPNTSLEFKDMTSSTINEDGQSTPKYQVPLAWLEEVFAELSRLLQVARVDRSGWLQKLMARPGYRGQDVHDLLAEEVRWAMHHGPYKQREARKEIGVLLECVGIERKGTFWF